MAAEDYMGAYEPWPECDGPSGGEGKAPESYSYRYVTYEKLIHETEKAILIGCRNGREYWIPRSQYMNHYREGRKLQVFSRFRMNNIGRGAKINEVHAITKARNIMFTPDLLIGEKFTVTKLELPNKIITLGLGEKDGN